MDRQQLAAAIREQRVWCERLGSPLYHALLLHIAEDIEASGVCWKVMEPHAGDAGRSLLPLRFLGAVHRWVLEGRLPRLARYYPSAGGTADPEAAWTAFVEALEQHGEALSASMPQTVQTNEVTRCCALAPGFLEIARHTGLPLRLLEIGASAGLHLRWDRYRYETADGAWGPAESSVVFRDAFTGGPPLDTTACVVERSGCDLNPVDVMTDDGRLTLLSFVWPDQADRFGNLSNAIQLARTVPASLERADAVEWLGPKLAGSHAGVATVVFHSITMLYLSTEARERVSQILTEAGERATTEAPLAWLSMEPGKEQTDVHLTLWPGGERKLIATAGYHGRNVMCCSNG